MKSVAKPGGRIVVLDYNHHRNIWEPDPPGEFKYFYSAFLEWRRVNRWDNQMADHLPELFQSQGIRNILVHTNDEIARRGEPDFAAASAIWTHVIETIGPKLVLEGLLLEFERAQAESVYRSWVHSSLQTQVLEVRTVEGIAP
jgi:hypothetical protein